MAQTALTSEQVSQYLVGNSLYLTSLEFLVEGQELGGFDLTYLKNFFSNTSRFPPEDLEKFQGEDALSNLLLAKEREQKLCLAEYELRVATEDLKQTKDQIEQKTVNYEGGNGVIISQSDQSSISLPDSEKPNLDLKQDSCQSNTSCWCRRHLNSVVFAYLLQSGYKVTAMTFQEEAHSDFEKTPVAEDSLLQYYRHSQEPTNKVGTPHSQNGDRFTTFSERESIITELEEDGFSKAATSPLSMHDHSPRMHQHGHKESDPPLPLSLCSVAPPPVDLIQVLTEALPKIIPGILINKRSECIPLICSLVGHHPDSLAKTKLIQLLFNLVKHPDDQQRKIIVDGIVTLSHTIGSDRTTQEIIPQFCELVDHKNLDRRLMVAEAIGNVAQFVERDIVGSLLFSLLRQLSGDAEWTVRAASLSSFISILKSMPIPVQKKEFFEDLLIGFIMDLNDRISEKARAKFGPLVLESNQGFSMKFLVKILKEAMMILEEENGSSSPPQRSIFEANGDQTGHHSNLIIPKNSQQKKILALLQFYIQLQNSASKLECFDFHCSSKNSSNHEIPTKEDGTNPFETNNSMNSNSPVENQKFEDWLDLVRKEDQGDSEEFDCFLFELIPTLLSIIQRISPVNECYKLREKLSIAIKATTKIYRPQLTEAFIRPLMISVSGVKQWIPCDQDWVEQVKTRVGPMIQEDPCPEYCILPVLFSAVIAETGEEEAYEFLKSLIEGKTHIQGISWVLQNPKDFIQIIVFLGGIHSIYELLLRSFGKLVTESGNRVKIGALLLAEALSLHAPLTDLTSILTPYTVKLAEDPSHLETQLQAIFTLQKMSIVYPNESELIRTIYNVMEKLMSSTSSFKVRLEALNACSSAVSACHNHAAFVLKQLPAYLQQFQDHQLTTGQSLHDLAFAIFNSLRVLEGVEILDSGLRTQLVTAMEWMYSDGAPFLDNAHRQILASMLSDKSSKIAKSSVPPSKASSSRSLGSSIHKTTFSSDASYTSEPPGL